MFKFKHSNTVQSKDRLIWYTLRNDSGKILKVFLLSINKPLSYYQSRKLCVYIKNTAIHKLWSSWIWLRPFRQRSLALQGMKACSVQRRHVVWSTPGQQWSPTMHTGQHYSWFWIRNFDICQLFRDPPLQFNRLCCTVPVPFIFEAD